MNSLILPRFLVYLLGLLYIAPNLLAAPPEGYRFHNLTDAMQSAAAQEKPMLLYFGRYGCSTCRKMHKEVFTNPGLQQDFNERFVLAYVDTESDSRIRLPNGERTTEMQFAARNRILGTPTFIYFDAAQKPLFKKAGFQTAQEMLAYNQFVADGHFRKQNLKQFMGAQ